MYPPPDLSCVEEGYREDKEDKEGEEG